MILVISDTTENVLIELNDILPKKEGSADENGVNSKIEQSQETQRYTTLNLSGIVLKIRTLISKWFLQSQVNYITIKRKFI